jgi:hypothetical protein
MLRIHGVRSALRLGIALTLGIAGVGISNAIAPQVAVAQQAGRVDLALNRQLGESFASFIQRAEAAAQTTVEQSFSRNPQLNQLQINVLGENDGLISPVLALDVSRSQWQSRPDAQAWSTRFGDSRVLLGFDSPQPDSESAQAEDRSTQPEVAVQKPAPSDATGATVADTPRPSRSGSSTVILIPSSGAGATVSEPTDPASTPSTESTAANSETSPSQTDTAADPETTRLGVPNIETDFSRLRVSDDGTLLETQERDIRTTIEPDQPLDDADSAEPEATEPTPTSTSQPQSTGVTAESSATSDSSSTIPQVPRIESPTVPTVPDGS